MFKTNSKTQKKQGVLFYVVTTQRTTFPPRIHRHHRRNAHEAEMIWRPNIDTSPPFSTMSPLVFIFSAYLICYSLALLLEYFLFRPLHIAQPSNSLSFNHSCYICIIILFFQLLVSPSHLYKSPITKYLFSSFLFYTSNRTYSAFLKVHTSLA